MVLCFTALRDIAFSKLTFSFTDRVFHHSFSKRYFEIVSCYLRTVVTGGTARLVMSGSLQNP